MLKLRKITWKTEEYYTKAIARFQLKELGAETKDLFLFDKVWEIKW